MNDESRKQHQDQEESYELISVGKYICSSTEQCLSISIYHCIHFQREINLRQREMFQRETFLFASDLFKSEVFDGNHDNICHTTHRAH